MSKLTSDKMIDGQPERERIERFCGTFVESDNRAKAYRLAFVVDAGKTFQYVMDKANALLRDPEVQDRIAQMREEAIAKTIVTMRQILQDFHDIATADPNELVSVSVDCCRFCNGVDHQYQWADEKEFCLALANALEASAKAELAETPEPAIPNDRGGYGYSPHNEPCMTCPSCFGRGYSHAQVHDTRKVSPQARKLYAGAKQTKDGIEIKMHDQMKAREMVGKIVGVFKAEGVPLVSAATAAKVAPVTVEDAQKAYLQLIG